MLLQSSRRGSVVSRPQREHVTVIAMSSTSDVSSLSMELVLNPLTDQGIDDIFESKTSTATSKYQLVCFYSRHSSKSSADFSLPISSEIVGCMVLDVDNCVPPWK